jgi:UDP-glucuronate decarboxylase
MEYQSIKSAENPIIWSDLNHIVSAFTSWEFFRSQTILITGGNGLLASYLVRTLLHANHLLSLNLHITCLVRSQRSELFRLAPWLHSSSLSLVYGDVETFQFDQLETQSIVIHAASVATPSVYQSNPVGIVLPNSLGTARLCQHAQIWSSQRFLFFSTGEVYGNNRFHSFAEDAYGYLDPTSLRSCYAESKRCGETTCVAYSHQYGLHAVIVRIFHTYGPQMKLDDGRVFADFIRDALEGKQIRLSSSGEAMRCFCYLSDATHGFLHLIVNGSSGQAYNLANPSAEISIRDLATLIAGLPTPSLEVCFANAQEFKPGYMQSPVQRSLPSIAKIQSLGWQPLVDLKQGFQRTLDSYLTQK